MSYYNLVFSPTGGTQRVADAITCNWPDVQTIDLTKPADYTKYDFKGDDIVLITFPSFGGLAPKPAMERLIKMNANRSKCILVAVYGNRDIDDTLVQMEDTAVAVGFKIIAGISAVAEHSVIRTIATGRPDAEDSAQLAEFVKKIDAKIEADDNTLPIVPGNRPYKKVPPFTMFPKTTKECTECGLCAKECPTLAIDPDNLHLPDKQSCCSCLRCMAICPNNARSISKLTVSALNKRLSKVCAERKPNELYI